MEAIKYQLLPYLKTDFEKKLLEAALVNLNEADNCLRLNNFAYAARELTRHFLERLAPDKEVLDAPWFKPYDPENPKLISREQRIRYAIQGYLSEEFTKNELHIDHSDINKRLRRSIDDLSKYTHVNPETFDVGIDVITEVSYNIMEDILRFFMTITEAKDQMMNAIYACIDKDMVSQFYLKTHSELDMLATHHEVMGYLVTDLTPLDRDDQTITVQADGTVYVRLQYGSDGDMRRDDGFETKMTFPFTSVFTASYKNKEGDIHIISSELNVNNDSFFE